MGWPDPVARLAITTKVLRSVSSPSDGKQNNFTDLPVPRDQWRDGQSTTAALGVQQVVSWLAVFHRQLLCSVLVCGPSHSACRFIWKVGVVIPLSWRYCCCSGRSGTRCAFLCHPVGSTLGSHTPPFTNACGDILLAARWLPATGPECECRLVDLANFVPSCAAQSVASWAANRCRH